MRELALSAFRRRKNVVDFISDLSIYLLFLVSLPEFLGICYKLTREFPLKSDHPTIEPDLLAGLKLDKENQDILRIDLHIHAEVDVVQGSYGRHAPAV